MSETGARVGPGGAFPFRFGLGVPTSGPFGQVENVLRFADAGERLGFDDIWLNDHLDFDRARMSGSPAGTLDAIKDQEPNFFESLTTAALLAGRLRRIGIAVGGLVAPLRQPVVLAKQIATIHELSGRRLTVAPGIGGGARDFGLVQKKFEQRGKLLDEYLAALHAIWSSEYPVSFSGPTVSFEGATLYPRPVGLRLWVTGEGEPALRRVVKWAGGWFTAYPVLEELTPKIARLRQLAEEAGRDPDTIDTATIIFLCIASSHDKAMAIGGETLSQRFRSSERAQAVSIIGTAAEAREQLAERFRAGLRYLELRFVCDNPDSWVAMASEVSADVLPALRTLTS
ncbi:MAG TPA: LLM class flavin-dependent oxidoreductase [Chloroflexota bacterium]|jgi:alkanesulfonate monooxygenase SsuD/methylene tetrahydromethanopterin reductase-like flavin-dependent oxidoreductase (luciferase family)